MWPGAKAKSAGMIENVKEKLADARETAVEKAAALKAKTGDLKEQAAQKSASIIDKVKDFTADALETGAEKAAGLADKLRH